MKYIEKIVVVLTVFIFASCTSDAHKVDVHREYYSSGALKAEYHMKNNKFDGIYKAFYESGVILATGQYKNGKRTGLWYNYHSNGKILSIEKLNNEHLISFDGWDKNGVQMVKDGTGTAKFYYDNGQIKSIQSFKNGHFCGKWESWFPNGVKESETYFGNNGPIKALLWNEQGELIMTKTW